MSLPMFVILLFIFFGATFIASLIEQITVDRSGIKISGNEVYEVLFDKSVNISTYIRYLYYTLVCKYPTMTVSGTFMFREGDVVKYSGEDGGLRQTHVLMIYNGTIILKPLKDGGILR